MQNRRVKMQEEVQKMLQYWMNNSHKLPIGIDDWEADYEELSGLEGKDIFINSHQDIIDLMLKYDISAHFMGQIATVAWRRGRISKKYLRTFNPKIALKNGQGKRIGWIVQKATAKIMIEDKEIEYKQFVGPMAYSKKDDHMVNETQNEHVQFFTNVLTKQGIKNVKSYLSGSILTQIKERLTQLKAADEDYKAEAILLKKNISKIVKELS